MSSPQNSNAIEKTAVILVTAVFLIMVGFGWYNLSANLGVFPAVIAGMMGALIAYVLAHMAARGFSKLDKSPEKFKSDRNWAFIWTAGLFFVSAFGIFNTFVLYSEGSEILADTAADSHDKFGALARTAKSVQKESGALAKANEIQSKADALFSEIQNEQNCGQGPVARGLILDIQRLLPGFEPLSGSGACKRSEALVLDYKAKIETLIRRAPWNSREVEEVVDLSTVAQKQLTELRADILRDYTPLKVPTFATRLDAYDVKYINARGTLSAVTDVKNIPETLDLTAARGLGKFSHVLEIFLGRLFDTQTVLLFIAAFLVDLFMVAVIKREFESRPLLERDSIIGGDYGR